MTAEESLAQHLEELDPTPSDEEIAQAEIEANGGERGEVEPARWAVRDIGAADWAMRRLAKAKTRRNSVSDLFRQQIDQLMAWRDKEFASCDRTTAFFEGALAEWAAAAVEEQGTKARSIRLPHGTVGFRAQQPSFHKDEDLLLREAKEHGLPVRVKEEADWGSIKSQIVGSASDGRAVLDGGIVLESVHVTPQPDAFYAKPSEEGESK